MISKRIPAVLAILSLVVGCATVPDTRPFTGATVGLRAAVASSGTVVVAELKQSPIAGMAALAKTLEGEWAARNKSMTALVAYANSLQSIADSGRNGEDSARQLADAASTLVDTLGVANPAASAAGSLVVDTFAYVYSQIAVARAAKSLEGSLMALQPAIERIAILFAADLDSLDDATLAAIDSQRDGLAVANRAELGFRKQLLATQRDLMLSVQGELSSGTVPSKLADADELRRVAELLADNAAWHTSYEESQARIAARGRLARELIAATKAAFGDWAAAHGRLLEAVREKRLPTVTELVEATARIRGLVDRYREL